MKIEKDILSALQSRIARRANDIRELTNQGYIDYLADLQKIDKKTVAEIVYLRRVAKNLGRDLSACCLEVSVLRDRVSEQKALIGKYKRQAQASSMLNV